MKKINKLPGTRYASIIFLVIIIGLPLSMKNRYHQSDYTPLNRIPKKIYYESETPKTECCLCENGTGTLIPAYRGQKNIGIISLNTFQLSYLQLNPYDETGWPRQENVHGSTQLHFTGDDCFSSHISINADRGYATGSIILNSEDTLYLSKAASFLCTDCLNYILEQSWGNSTYGIGVIDFQTLDIRLFEESVSAFSFGDYYISCSTNSDHEGDKKIDFMAFYCPSRYD